MIIRFLGFLLFSTLAGVAHAESQPRCYCPVAVEQDKPLEVTLLTRSGSETGFLEDVIMQTGATWARNIYWDDPDVRDLVERRSLDWYGAYLSEFSKLSSEEQCMLADIVDTAWNPETDGAPPPAFPCM